MEEESYCEYRTEIQRGEDIDRELYLEKKDKGEIIVMQLKSMVPHPSQEHAVLWLRKEVTRPKAWSSLVEGGEGSYLPKW